MNSKIRSRVKKLSSSINDQTWELARLLVEIYDDSMYLDWGFKTWKEYVELEVQVHIRKAQELVRTQKWLLKLDDDMAEWIRSMGSSKARYMVGNVSRKDFETRKAALEELTVTGMQKMFVVNSKADREYHDFSEEEYERLYRVFHELHEMDEELSFEDSVAKIRNAGVSAELLSDEIGLPVDEIRSAVRHVHFFVPVVIYEKMVSIAKSNSMGEPDICRFLLELGVDMIESDVRRLNGADPRRLSERVKKARE